ncbi:MAG: response regulator [Prevotellaceae bacterium]|jgi:signal transduction histidine kinase/DNA-binding response OmpR family regulator/ligand-binding sensor domain-containing protein|nr:response regulator [Prevotellaceae bacterium]
MLRKTVLLTSLLLCFGSLFSHNLRQLSSKEGLSNSAILSIYQDKERFMWFGSCDGLNMYDGLHIQVYKPTTNNPNSLSGNLIEGIMGAEDNILWIATNHGFNRLDKKKRTIEYHNEFQGKYHWAKTVQNEVFAIREDHFIHYYNKERKEFIPVSFPGIYNDNIQAFFIDPNNTIWILSDNGKTIHAAVSFTDMAIPHLKIVPAPEHDADFLYVFHEKERVYLIDKRYLLYELNVLTQKKNLIKNLRYEIRDNGIISTIIRDGDDYLIAFKTNGLIRLKHTPETELKYRTERIDIYCGVFSLCRDEGQDIVWIGTDGQGVYMYSNDAFSFRSITFTDLPFHIQKPVRALLIDKNNTLWIGTKDDGILTIDDFQINGNINTKKIDHYTTNNSALTNNTIYAFANSRRNLIWIGGDGPGLNYYSYKEKRIKPMSSRSDEEIVYVHSICEVNDTTLWVATVGSGILKVIVDGSYDVPYIKTVKRFMFIKDEISYNYFFSALQENDSLLWFGNRGYGVQRLDVRTETFTQIRFSKKDIETINDILSGQKDRKGNIWFGTSFGITRLLHYDKDTVVYENYNEIEGLPNNTIHGILEDHNGHLWLSTNNGIVQFDVETKKFRIYNHKNGLDVIEFSDGAYFRDERTGILLFGGTNGFLSITQDVFEGREFTPPIYFTGLKIYENEYNIVDFMRQTKNGEYLELPYEQNFFSISFIAPDYINGQHYRYAYNLENFNDQWFDKGFSNVVTFTKVPPGEYILHIKYDNGITTSSQNDYSLKIVILPPWYKTIWAYLAYTLLCAAILYGSLLLVRASYKNKRTSMIEKMNQQQKEEIYESKLRFFTNITHELCTPLTLIYGPCARIVSYAGTDTFVRKYATLILKNAERLNSLIQELIEFRRIETGHKFCLIEPLAITELARNIAESFIDLAETRNIDYQIHIDEPVEWNSDKGCITKILTNLLSNAFKYTPDNGKIEVIVNRKDETLQMLVSNTGKGIKEKDIPLIFDRYTVLENFERQTRKGLSSRNGLGLAICHNMVKLLNGEISVHSDPDTLTEFKVLLPYQEPNLPGKREMHSEEVLLLQNFGNNKTVIETKDYKFIKSRSTILVIDDDPEMLWFVSEIFKEHYNVIPVADPTTVAETLERIQPQLIISDIMMPQLDGITLLKQMKANKRTGHIPFIFLSAKNTPEEQVEGIEAGAEMYITKPFNVDYLKSVADRLLQRQDDLKDYYNSAISSFELSGGKYIHKDERSFLDKAIKIMDVNITDPNFSTDRLASQLGMSARHLYRRMKKIINQTPADLIKEYRLSIVKKLLITTQLSIDEIMYKAGYINRGSFYRAFAQKFGTTPKNYRKKQASE